MIKRVVFGFRKRVKIETRDNFDGKKPGFIFPP